MRSADLGSVENAVPASRFQVYTQRDLGKIEIQGVTAMHGERVFILRFIQGRNPDWVQRPFFARYDEQATWLDDLKPAFGEETFCFEPEYREMLQGRAAD